MFSEVFLKKRLKFEKFTQKYSSKDSDKTNQQALLSLNVK